MPCRIIPYSATIAHNISDGASKLAKHAGTLHVVNIFNFLTNAVNKMRVTNYYLNI